MGLGYRDYVLERSELHPEGVPLRLEFAEADWLASDGYPRQVARIQDPVTRSEWVMDMRRFGDQVQIRSVEYSADGMWMPHVWVELPRGAEVWFVLPNGLDIRGGAAMPRRRTA